MFQSKQKELAKNTAILTAGKICTQFISFFLMPLYTAILDPEEYGVVDLFSTYVSLLVPLIGLMLEQGLFRFLLDNRDNKNKEAELFSNVIFLDIIMCVIYGIIFAIISRWIASPYKIFLLTNVILNVFSGSLLQFSRGIGHNVNYAIASFLSAATNILSNIIMIIVLHKGAYGLFYSIIISQFVVIIFLFAKERCWRFVSVHKLNRGTEKELLKYSLPLIPANLSWWVINVSDRSIVSYVLGVAANGIYSVANKFSTVCVTFYNIFILSWNESVSLYINDDDRDVFLTETINTLFRLFSGVCLGITAVMPFVYPIMINEQYSDGYYQVPILMLSVLFETICGMYSAIYVAVKKTNEQMKTALFAAIINVAVNVILINRIGLYAASISTAVAYAAMSVYRYFDSQKYVKAVISPRLICIVSILTVFEFFLFYLDRTFTDIINLIVCAVVLLAINKDFIATAFMQFVKIIRKDQGEKK